MLGGGFQLSTNVILYLILFHFSYCFLQNHFMVNKVFLWWEPTKWVLPSKNVSLNYFPKKASSASQKKFPNKHYVSSISSNDLSLSIEYFKQKRSWLKNIVLLPCTKITSNKKTALFCPYCVTGVLNSDGSLKKMWSKDKIKFKMFNINLRWNSYFINHRWIITQSSYKKRIIELKAKTSWIEFDHLYEKVVIVV